MLLTIVSINLVADQLRDVLNPGCSDEGYVIDSAEAITEPVLEVEGLRTHFFTKAGVVKAVDDVSFSVGRGEVLGLVGESGSGKSMTGYSLMGLIDPPGKIVAGSIVLDGVEQRTLSAEQQRRMRGNRIAMIFQDPMMTLNPVLRIDVQMVEAILAQKRVSKEVARSRAREALGSAFVAGRAAARVSAPVLRRHAPAGGHRDRDAQSARPSLPTSRRPRSTTPSRARSLRDPETDA